LIWQYRFDPVTKAMTVSRNQPPPTYSHRCFMVIKSAGSSFTMPGSSRACRADLEGYRRLIRQVLSRNPRRASTAPERIVIPAVNGFAPP